MLITYIVIKNKRASLRGDTPEYYAELAHKILVRYPISEFVDEESLTVDVSDSHAGLFIRDMSVVRFRWRFITYIRTHRPDKVSKTYYLPLRTVSRCLPE